MNKIDFDTAAAQLALAEQLLEFSAAPRVGLTGESMVAARSLAINILRPLVQGFDRDAAWLLAGYAESEAECDCCLATAGALGHPKALAEAAKNLPLRLAIERKSAEFGADYD